MRTRAALIVPMVVSIAIAAQSAFAASITLIPDADADIRSSVPTDGFNRTVLVVGGNANMHKTYVRFELPSDFGTATSATFTVVRALARPSGYSTQVWGLDDGVAGEANWVEANGAGGASWNSAPGNDTTSFSNFNDAAVLGNFTTVGTGSGGAAGDSYSVSGAPLVSFLNADSNGFVTLMLAYTSSTSTNEQFAAQTGSGTATPYDGPRLTLEYEPIPEPASLSLAAVVGGFLLMGARRRR